MGWYEQISYMKSNERLKTQRLGFGFEPLNRDFASKNGKILDWTVVGWLSHNLGRQSVSAFEVPPWCTWLCQIQVICQSGTWPMKTVRIFHKNSTCSCPSTIFCKFSWRWCELQESGVSSRCVFARSREVLFPDAWESQLGECTVLVESSAL